MKNTDFTLYLTITPAELRKRQLTKGWALSLIGFILYGVLRLFRQKLKDYKGICPYFEIGKQWVGLELGWFLFAVKAATILPSGTRSVTESKMRP